jgi:predicted glycogen debranching enzyme
MDAVVDGHVITPRIGKPVEIQALWINALEIAGETELAARARASFVARFWDVAHKRLYDVVDCDGVAGTVDASCRPNQIFAVGGLPFQILDGDHARSVVDRCFEQLWTPRGPRSLAPGDPRYVAHYGGNSRARDGAYHNGTVWPWLAGPFVEAWVRVYGDKHEARARFLAPLLAGAHAGHLPEICDADVPHRAVGCPFQAWSVAEALRLDLDVLA